jgi:hypothetical protein
VVGPAHTLFADCVARVSVITPELVTGLLPTVRIEEGAVRPTEVTLPLPTPTERKAVSIADIVASYSAGVIGLFCPLLLGKVTTILITICVLIKYNQKDT